MAFVTVHAKSIFHVLLLAILFCSSVSAQPTEKPNQIVSLSLCTDQLLLLLADKTNIASISYLSNDPQYSTILMDTSGLIFNRGQAEEVLSFNPDVILSSQFSATASINLLQRLGHSVNTFGFPANLFESYEQIKEFASLINEEEKAESLISEMQNSIAQAINSLPDMTTIQTGLFLDSNGFTYGNNTLRNNFLNQFGFSNSAAEIGINGVGQISIEDLITSDPDFLIIDEQDENSQRLAYLILEHPALKKQFASKPIITIPSSYFQCAGPSLTQAFTMMAKSVNEHTQANLP